MKVKLEERYREVYTLAELDAAKAVIAWEKDDLMTATEYAESAVNHIIWKRFSNDGLREVIKAEARTAKHRGVWELYGEGTRDLDVWINFIAETFDGFIKGGAYLSDIWAIGGDVDITGVMYYNRYTIK